MQLWSRTPNGQQTVTGREAQPAVGCGRATAVLGRQPIAARWDWRQGRLLLQDVENGCAGWPLIGVCAQAILDEDPDVFWALLRDPACME